VLVVGGIVQFLAGMWAHRRGNMLTATAFSALGGFYAAFALLLMFVTSRVLVVLLMGDSIRGVTGIFMLTFAALIAGLGVAALQTNRLLAGIFFLLAVAYLFDGLGIWLQPLRWFLLISRTIIVGEAERSGWLLAVGGYLGLIAAVLALYQAVATVVNSASGHESWPVFGVRRQAAVRPPAPGMPPATPAVPQT
jgi:succinate-acetate transporter protein